MKTFGVCTRPYLKNISARINLPCIETSDKQANVMKVMETF